VNVLQITMEKSAINKYIKLDEIIGEVYKIVMRKTWNYMDENKK